VSNRPEELTPLTAAQQDVVVQLLPAVEAVVKSAWRTKWRPPCVTFNDYRDEALLPLMGWVATNTNADGSDPEARTTELFQAHAGKRVEDRLKNYRKKCYRYLQGKRVMKRDLAGRRGWRKKRPRDVLTHTRKDGKGLLLSGPVRQSLIHRTNDDPALVHADVRSRVAAALRRMAATDPEATECFVLKHSEGLTIEEIARQTGLSRDQVNRRLKKAKGIILVLHKELDQGDQRDVG
jgi:hypothetical protein